MCLLEVLKSLNSVVAEICKDVDLLFHWFNESLTGIAVVAWARDVNRKKGIKPAPADSWQTWKETLKTTGFI